MIMIIIKDLHGQQNVPNMCHEITTRPNGFSMSTFSQNDGSGRDCPEADRLRRTHSQEVTTVHAFMVASG